MGIRDYLEGLQSLRIYSSRFITLREKLDAARRNSNNDDFNGISLQIRSALVWLCQTLWARSQQEKDLIQNVICQEIPLADNQNIYQWFELSIDTLEAETDALEFEEPAVVFPRHSQTEETAAEPPLGSGVNDDAKGDTPSRQSQVSGGEQTVGVDTVEDASMGGDSDSTSSDIVMPVLGEITLDSSRPFHWVVEPELGELWLLALWRRLYKPTKIAERDLVDINKTVAHLCETGFLVNPVMLDRAFNTAELLLLIDVNNNMTPWKKVSEILAKTALSKLSRLKSVQIYFFNKIPGTDLYLDPRLLMSKSSDSILQANQHSYIVVFSDCGAASREFDSTRIKRLDLFLEKLATKSNRRTLWINPMPANRWLTEFTAVFDSHPIMPMFELSANDLLQAVDYLRS